MAAPTPTARTTPAPTGPAMPPAAAGRRSVTSIAPAAGIPRGTRRIHRAAVASLTSSPRAALGSSTVSRLIDSNDRTLSVLSFGFLVLGQKLKTKNGRSSGVLGKRLLHDIDDEPPVLIEQDQSLPHKPVGQRIGQLR